MINTYQPVGKCWNRDRRDNLLKKATTILVDIFKSKWDGTKDYFIFKKVIVCYCCWYGVTED